MNHEVLITEQQTVDLLLLEDDEVDFDSVKRQLENAQISFDVTRVVTLKEACERLKGSRFQLVLADLNLPDSRGVETVDGLAEYCQQTVLLVMTGVDDEDVELEVLNRGAHGYFIKGEIQVKAILRTIQHSLRCERHIRQHRALVEHLQTQNKSLDKLSKELGEENKLLRTAHHFRFRSEATDFNCLVNHLSKEQIAVLAVEAEQASRAKSEFLATASHELRTSMEGVLSIHDHLMRSYLNDQQQALVEASLASNMNLLRMVREMSEIARIETGRTQVQPFLCDLSAVLEEIALSAKPLLKAKGVSVHWSVDNKLSEPVLCDGILIRQILSLLISNAIKFTDQGRIDIRGATLSSDRSRGCVRISVADTGVGISPDMFEDFQAAFASGNLSEMPPLLSPSLGLSHALQIVRILGGEMGVESTRWKGSNFWCDIPIGYPDVNPDQRTDQANSPLLKRPHFLKRNRGNSGGQISRKPTKHCLIAHESRALQLYLVEQLRQLGYSADTAKNGSDVMYLLGKKPFDLLLIDCHLPVHNVFSIANRVDKATMLERNPKIIAISDRFSDETSDRIEYENIDAFLTVPLEVAQLRDALQRC
ncbi:response regulator [Bremerella sp. JC770]|uniref:response regulator n=1 Tax=Bremerella sp. JC770 TaxID=3232137 RepID=UPI003458049C